MVGEAGEKDALTVVRALASLAWFAASACSLDVAESDRRCDACGGIDEAGGSGRVLEGGDGGSMTGLPPAQTGGSPPLGDAGAVAAYECLLQRQQEAAGDGIEGQSCCDGAGLCAPSQFPDAGAGHAYHSAADCDSARGLICAAADPIGGPCTTYLGVERRGRCVPRCLVERGPSAGIFTRGNCSPGDGSVLCVPCTDPVTGAPTGICEPADAGASPTLEVCGRWNGGAAMGVCVGRHAIVESAMLKPLQRLFPQDVCDSTSLCVPRIKAMRAFDCAAPCEAPMDPSGQGACVPTYLVELGEGAGFSASLGQRTCDDGETCTPCTNPLGFFSTGACAL